MNKVLFYLNSSHQNSSNVPYKTIAIHLWRNATHCASW